MYSHETVSIVLTNSPTLVRRSHTNSSNCSFCSRPTNNSINHRIYRSLRSETAAKETQLIHHSHESFLIVLTTLSPQSVCGSIRSSACGDPLSSSCHKLHVIPHTLAFYSILLTFHVSCKTLRKY